MRSVWFCENALLTVCIAAMPTSKLVLQSVAVDDVTEDCVLALGDGLGDFVGEAVGDALGVVSAASAGLGLASVMVIVVTPFCTVAVTSAPVVPRRSTAATAPDFACRNSARRRSNILELTPFHMHRTSGPSALLGRRSATVPIDGPFPAFLAVDRSFGVGTSPFGVRRDLVPRGRRRDEARASAAHAGSRRRITGPRGRELPRDRRAPSP